MIIIKYRILLIENNTKLIYSEANTTVALLNDYYNLRMQGKICFLQRFSDNGYIFIYHNGKEIKNIKF